MSKVATFSSFRKRTHAGLDSAVIKDGALKPWDQEMCALRCSLYTNVCMSSPKKYASGMYLVLYTREPVEHNCTVTSWYVIDTCLEQSSGNADGYYTQSEHIVSNVRFVRTHQQAVLQGSVKP